MDSTPLQNSQRGFGPEPTWPRGMPLLGVGIDHCLVTEPLQVLDRTRGPFLGSDHRVLEVELALGSSVEGT